MDAFAARFVLREIDRSVLKEAAKALGIEGGRKWSAIPDDEILRLHAHIYALRPMLTEEELDRRVEYLFPEEVAS